MKQPGEGVVVLEIVEVLDDGFDNQNHSPLKMKDGSWLRMMWLVILKRLRFILNSSLVSSWKNRLRIYVRLIIFLVVRK